MQLASMNAMPALEVVAGVLEDGMGRVLLAQRPAGKDQAGLWEFPGGKCRPGESPPAALARELREELGIDIEVGERLLRSHHANARQALILDTWRIRRWHGEPAGLEGQALAWVAVDELDAWPMPAPDRPVVSALRLSPYYAISPEPAGDPDRFAAEFESNLQRQSTWLKVSERPTRALIQLRCKHLDDDTLRPLARRCLALANAYEATLLLNGRPLLAAELGVGLHLTAMQLHDAAARAFRRLPTSGRWLAASCHTADELRLAATIGCDFVTVSPVQATLSHPDAAVLDWSGLAMLTETSSLPCYALGGITPGQLAIARRHGAFGVAGIRAF